jgi:Protein of unknown function (DUF3618)
MTGTDREAPPRDAEQVRSELADTVEELAHRLDVPARMRDKRDETARRVQAQVTHAREVVAQRAPVLSRRAQQRPGLVAAVALVMVFLLINRLRRTHRDHKDRDRKDRDGTR